MKAQIHESLNRKIEEALHNREGCIHMEYIAKDLFNQNIPAYILFNFVSSNRLVRLERTHDFLLYYYYSDPIVGTRVATVDLKEVTPCQKIMLLIGWSPRETILSVGPRGVEGEYLHEAQGQPSEIAFRIGLDGSIYEISSQSQGLRAVSNGNLALLPTAIEYWEETFRMTEVLASGSSKVGLMYDIAVANVILSTLVSGFEVYTKRRFLELESGGITPDTDTIIDRFYSKFERDSGISEVLKERANEKGVSLLRCIVESGTINFQNYGDCKKAFSKAYSLSFGNIGTSSQIIENLKLFIQYRHKVVHADPLLPVYNISEHPSKHVKAGPEVAEQARQCFNSFIVSLHEFTLKI